MDNAHKFKHDRFTAADNKKVAPEHPASVETVSGTVTDAASGESLPGVNVLVQGTASGTSTDSEGNYSLNVPSLQDTLVFSFIGYQTQSVPINGRSSIDIALQSQAISGEELVVVGYGTQEKANLTGSVSSVGGDEIVKRPVTNTASMLQGRAPGVQVVQNSGQPDVMAR
ncbi:carboxypeptidase-like regulatory domain-containing protein [Aliifodinibius sp. S!AR15-10]|uniref:carboxypeptidase-like regulatory domain-containing protein n=1 Tax=Aliifodinibius sp. S!AR15-10 TaxID=2950437 RepID=UPI0028645F86|nr:carboxypeptidase-like regulatory domain-containing protein [Aliifodinibius sp. S!AR15-10]MDR8394593.1 carboxypeptidase-like regulatory domain-containing protein [Aliifodinibius sp. S!AR15-10]